MQEDRPRPENSEERPGLFKRPISNEVAHALNAVLLTALWGFALWSFSGLPDSIPVHFGASGVPDRWVERSMTAWLVLPGTGLGLTAMFYLVALGVGWTARHPENMNMPADWKERILAATPEQRRMVFAVFKGLFYWQGVPVSILLLWLLVGSWRVAMGTAETIGPIGPMVTLFAGVVAVMVLHLVAVYREVKTLPPGKPSRV